MAKRLDDRCRYRLTRISAGDYLLPSNDGQWLWRIASYAEDGSAETMDGRTIRGVFWMVARHRTPLDRLREGFDAGSWVQPPDLLDWDEWEQIEFMLDSRAEAVKRACDLGVAS